MMDVPADEELMIRETVNFFIYSSIWDLFIKKCHSVYWISESNGENSELITANPVQMVNCAHNPAICSSASVFAQLSEILKLSSTQFLIYFVF